MRKLKKARGLKQGGVITDPAGQWKHPGEVTRINSPDITMEGVNYPVYGIPDKGPGQLMMPGGQYHYPGAINVTEYPMKNKSKQLGGLAPAESTRVTPAVIPSQIFTPAGQRQYTKDQRKKSADVNNQKAAGDYVTGTDIARNALGDFLHTAGIDPRDVVNNPKKFAFQSALGFLPSPATKFIAPAVEKTFGKGLETAGDYLINTIGKDFLGAQTRKAGTKFFNNRVSGVIGKYGDSKLAKPFVENFEKMGGAPMIGDGQGNHLSVQPMDTGGSSSSQSNFPQETNRNNEFLNIIKKISYNHILNDLHTGALMPDGSFKTGSELQDIQNQMKKGGGFKINPAHKGWCTPMTKSTCTGKRRQFAINAKHHFKKQQNGGEYQDGSTVDYGFQGPYHPAYDYIPNVGQKSYKQFSAQPGQPFRSPIGPYQDEQSQDFQQQFSGPQMNTPMMSTENDPTAYNNPMWTNQDMNTRNTAMSKQLNNLQQTQITDPLNQSSQQTSITNANIINSAKPENIPTMSNRTVRPNWKDRWWASPDLLNAGMDTATGILNSIDRKKQEKWLKTRTAADSWNNPIAGNRGDYTQNNGYFRPDQNTPVQFTGAAGFHQNGGGVVDGDYDMSPEEIMDLKAKGYNVELL